MLSTVESMLALRYLRSRRQEGFISVVAWFSFLGIMLGVATLIVVMSVMNGFREELMSRILGVNGHITVYGPSFGISKYDELSERLQKIQGVETVTSFIEGQVLATGGGFVQGAMVRGLRKSDLEARAVFRDGIDPSALAQFEGTDVVLVGRKMMEKMHLQVGDGLTLVSPKGNRTVMGVVPRTKKFTIIGSFDVGMYEYDSGTVLMPLEAAQVYFQLPESVSAIELRMTSPELAPRSTNEVIRQTGGMYRVYDWQQANASFVNALQVERNVMFLILTLIIIVAAFNIISSMIMLVKDKTRDIAILRTMGMSRGSLLRVFFATGSAIGVFGTLAGFLLGWSFASNIESIRQWLQSLIGMELFSAEIYYLTRIPAIVRNEQVLAIIIMALVITFLATLYPAWRASKVEPAEALRYG